MINYCTFRRKINGTFIANFFKKAIMKIPALLMASLLAVGVSAQTTKPATKAKRPVKKVKKIAPVPESPEKPKPIPPGAIAKKDTVRIKGFSCPACGKG